MAAIFAVFISAAMVCPTTVNAGQAIVIAAKATSNANGTYAFTVTIRHGDEGWDHYADRFDVLDPSGKVLGRRVLFHPHVDEQPFTRSLSGVKVPKSLTTVYIRAHDKVHGDSKKLFELKITPQN